MKSIYLRNFTWTATLILLCFLFLLLLFLGMGREYIVEQSVSSMKDCAAETARMASVIADADSLSSWELSRSLTSIGRITGDHVFITDADGVILSCSDELPFCNHLGFRLSSEIMENVKDNNFTRMISTLGGLYQDVRVIITLPILSESTGKIVGYVFESNYMKELIGGWTNLQNLSLLVSIVLFIVILAAALYFSKRMARPLDEMAAASRKFARGDFSVRVKQTDSPSSEMGALIDSFNSMADSLEKAEGRRSEFISNISHELRTPMTTIAGFADGILDGTIPEEDEKKYLKAISDETKRLSRLVRDMLDVSRMKARSSDPSKRTEFDLTELVLQTMLSFESRATAKGLDCDPQIPDSSIMVRADRDAITQVIYNLIDNAVKFAEVGSVITVRLYKENSKAFVAIKDRGETIPKDDLPLIFDRFHKSDRSRSIDTTGVGLGLYLVKSIINSHDEDIAVKSENGETEFVFTLPLV